MTNRHTGALDLAGSQEDEDLPSSIPAAAVWWLTWGLQPIPVNSNKETAVKWEAWLATLSADSLCDWWRLHPDAGVGAIIDDRVLVLDADTPASLAALREIERAFDHEPNQIHRTRKGEHHLFRRVSGTFAKMDSHSSDAFPDRIDVRTGRSATKGRSMVVSPPSPGRTVVLAEAASVAELIEVGQDFIDAIARHNGRQAPRAAPPQPPRAPGPGGHDELVELLSWIDPDIGYQDWLHVLMGIHHETGGSDLGLAIADAWSSFGTKYPGAEMIEEIS